MAQETTPPDRDPKPARDFTARLRSLSEPDYTPGVFELFARLKERLPFLREVWKRTSDAYEDGTYLLYHQSYKVFHVQFATNEIVGALRSLRPEAPLNPWFLEIVQAGTGREFTPDANAAWLPATRPIVEAFLHARYFLEMAVRYGGELEHPPRLMPSGWAAVLTLYGLR